MPLEKNLIRNLPVFCLFTKAILVDCKNVKPLHVGMRFEVVSLRVRKVFLERQMIPVAFEAYFGADRFSVLGSVIVQLLLREVSFSFRKCPRSGEVGKGI